ncbi:MAG: ABC transporter substrate-binding protein [Hyphomicrobiales bacterium]
MRFFIVIIFLLFPQFSFAQTWEERQLFGAKNAPVKLNIISSTDTPFFGHVIKDFLKNKPNVSVDYMVTGTADLDRIFRANAGDFDLVISSAMDLQFKLANDGFARQLENITLPNWAKWRDSIFAFTLEPATIVINKKAFDGFPIPRTRQELIKAMRARPDVFRNRVGTYDVRSSGLGYLFATQDARASDTFWRLMEVIGGLNAKLYCCSSEMINDLADGTIAVAYNVLGSYASARTDTHDALEIILPSDYPTTMMRTAMVSKLSENAELSTAFVDHLINHQPNAADNVLPPLISDQSNAGQITIILEPALMTYLDKLKRRTFLSEWENAVIHGQ